MRPTSEQSGREAKGGAPGSSNPEPASKTPDLHLPALTGVRFFAILHIFFYHLWAVYDMDKDPPFDNLLIGFEGLPDTVVTFLAHGWMSTSFFFLLSGFILAYLYWGEDGRLSTTKKRFWIARLSRIYPIHLIVLLLTVALTLGLSFGTDKPVIWAVVGVIFNAALLQSWYPPFVPLVSWPTWAISTLVFLYFLMPYLMRWFSRLSDKQMTVALCVLPLISLIPTAIYAYFFPPGSDPGRDWQIFIGSTPLFWIPHFAAGMLLSRVFRVSRFHRDWHPEKSRPVSWGDLSLLIVIGISCIPAIGEEPVKYFFRHGLMMPFYMLIILDLARHQGLLARLLSLPGTGFLGETGYSIFIWQNMIMMACWISVMIVPTAGQYQLWAAPLAVILIAVFSTYVIEKPLARRIRRKFGR
jgi:peptidoglycan/LPS O-acetylase OafA/YrhL